MSSPLSKYFVGAGAKKLSLVEVSAESSNQHEFNGASAFKKIFGTERVGFRTKFIYLTDEEEQIIEDDGQITWYDAREKHLTRSEFRLYYTPNEVVKKAKPFDLLIVGKVSKYEALVIIAQEGSTVEHQLIWLFGLQDLTSQFEVKDYRGEVKDIGFAGRYIISSLGIEIEETSPDYKEILLKKYGTSFPKTVEFSDFARSTVMGVSSIEYPDEALIKWLEREELLFRTLEREIVQQKLLKGFGGKGNDVDEFISFSLSVQNRRKSRAGHSFENNLAVIFKENGISFKKGSKTERNNKPDFIFPSESAYHDPKFPLELLDMLGAKTTAKDRWRQVLSEADRISRKHLITLEPAISKNQSDEMIAQNLQLVIPKPIISSYSEDQQSNIITLSEFIGMLKEKQLLCESI